MNLYTLDFHERATYQLGEVGRRSERLQSEITESILLLRDDPYPPNAKSLHGKYTGSWVIKIEQWRVIYEVREKDRLILIIAIRQRSADTYLNVFD